ncbi:MAG: sigma 54-interacting transcriptional regulator [Lentimicrobium sp.]|jgi:transcriptional regulator with PAS, ATPase and Fis domain|nr:sigma 54-interacting transcriptional regulator [Lentimicrobium sp.]MDD2527318.1 sigma 54-interacting transcriptional regulator [Lentimicrobiaceae bacterium]MDD4597171.1 sigma 54-interacting transcriptional regulator [Lentimicrobiaceae bacterium]MDY0025395.1 sigma 54-interacting transcriptional regulator [Lentimicrobium sp.]HAH56878.1 sigma-54-dependent Fis family transcriptional regulator [Bacteroidales bacterium]
MDIQQIKQRFSIIGHSSLLDRAIDVARQVAATDITVLITGESGVGKEVFPQIIHQLSARKHGPYIAVNCGAIPEGTIDSELFGHEKGSFTGAVDSRKGYFEVVSGGTIFLDEVADLPLSTQVRLLRVLETGEFIKVGASKVLKTDVRVVAATNVDIADAINKGKFRQDLYYRLSTVPIHIPPLRDRKEDIVLLFKKFANDFAEKYRMPPLDLDDKSKQMLMQYRWNGNIRQLKNITEHISIIEPTRMLTPETLVKYLPGDNRDLPVLYNKEHIHDISERELLYKVLFDMKHDINELKKLVVDILAKGEFPHDIASDHQPLIRQLIKDVSEADQEAEAVAADDGTSILEMEGFYTPEVLDESLSLQKKEIDLIRRAIEKHGGKRKNAAKELGISERTLYRKIKEYDIR